MAAALAAATLAAAADGFTAVVELAALLAVDDEGRVVAELLDLLNPELDLDEVEDGGLLVAGVLAGPLPGFVDASLLVVAVVDAFVTAGLGLALEVELALEGCLDTVVVGVGRGLAAAGRGAVDDVGRFGSVLVSAATLATGFGLVDGLGLGRGVLAGGLATPFSVGLVARGFLSPTLAACCGCFTVRFSPSVGFSVVGLVGLAAAPTVEELGLVDPADLVAVEPVELVGLLGATLAVGLVVSAFPAVPAPAGFVVVLLAVLGPTLLP